MLPNSLFRVKHLKFLIRFSQTTETPIIFNTFNIAEYIQKPYLNLNTQSFISESTVQYTVKIHSLKSSQKVNLQGPSSILNRNAHAHFYERFEVQRGACRLGHEEKEEGVQTSMKAAQTHGCFEVHVEAVCSIQEQLHVVEEVQDSGGSEAH